MIWTSKEKSKALMLRDNIIIRKFGFLQLDVKCKLFKTYCYPLYTCSLWSNYTQACIQRLKVAYNHIMRRLTYVATWQSASFMFASLGERSFGETLRICSYSLLDSIDKCPNLFTQNLAKSDAASLSRLCFHWQSILC